MTSFTTDGHTAYHLRTATFAPDSTAVVSACYDGAVLCHAPGGKRIWRADTGGHFPYDVAIGDIDGDGLDEVAVATAAGILYAFDHDGRALWTFEQTAPLFQAAIARRSDGNSVVVTGGVEHVLTSISPDGSVVGSLKTENCIRHVRAGSLLNAGSREGLAIATASGGLSGKLSLFIVDPDTLEPVVTEDDLGTHAHDSGKRFFSMVLLDIDGDGRDEIVLSNSWGENGKIFAFNAEGQHLYTQSDDRIPNISYRMNLLHHIALPDDDYILGHFGNVLIQYELDGSCRDVISGPYSFAGAAFCSRSRALFMGSAVEGGDGIHTFQLDDPEWRSHFESVQPVGKLAQIIHNLESVNRQIEAFQAPAYQPPPRSATVATRYHGRPEAAPSDARKGGPITWISGMTLSQTFESRDELWCKDIDRRRKYDLSADEIVGIARAQEEKGEAFLIWSGHGHAVHFPLSTFQRIIEAAPRTLWGFEFAEMEGVDDLMVEVVEQIILPLAELCRANGNKKIIIRNKNIFWNGTCYMPFWKQLLFDGKYSSVFVPSLEETNCRTHDLSLMGRIGMWRSGAVDRWSCRMVTDNANFDRMWEWAGQQVLTHHIRHLVSRAAHGADIFVNDIHQGPFSAELYRQLEPFYEMLEKGIIHIPQKDQLLSVSDAAIGMVSPPSEQFIGHGTNGHRYRYPVDEHPEMVLDRLDAYWAGSPLPNHDLSTYASDVHSRLCNFLPANPHGLVPIVPDDAAVTGALFRTDGERFIDEKGARKSASEMRTAVASALTESGDRLPIRVTGDVHWSVVRLDDTHVRITLIDSGYLDPADRDAVIILQHLEGVSSTDILSGEELPIDDGRISVQVPMGVFRIVDVQHHA